MFPPVVFLLGHLVVVVEPVPLRVVVCVLPLVLFVGVRTAVTLLLPVQPLPPVD